MHVIFGKILFHRNISLYDMMEAGKDAHCGEVVCALYSAQGHSADELMRIYEKKHIERGGFSKRIFFVGEGFRNKFIMKKGKNWYIL